MKILLIVLLIFCSGCAMDPAMGQAVGWTLYNSGQNYQNNMRALYYQQALDRQNFLMQQQNMILQQMVSP